LADGCLLSSIRASWLDRDVRDLVSADDLRERRLLLELPVFLLIALETPSFMNQIIKARPAASQKTAHA